jgi:hypothetical protein
MDNRIEARVVPQPRNRTLISQTRISVRFDDQGGRPRNLGLDVAVAERATGRSVPRRQIRDDDRPGRGRESGQEVRFFRPEIQSQPVRPPRDESQDVADDPRVEQQLRAQRDEDQRKLDQRVDQERRKLEAEHRREEMQQPGGQPDPQMKQRHDDEIKALEDQKERERKIIEGRYQKKIARGKGRGKGPREN